MLEKEEEVTKERWTKSMIELGTRIDYRTREHLTCVGCADLEVSQP